MKTTCFYLGLAMLFVGLFIPSAPAAITVIRDYHMGGADPGAMAGDTATNSVDSASTNDLTLVGSPIYSADTPTNSTFTNSTLSLDFNGTNYGLAAGITNLSNFGLEAWVKPTTNAGTYYVAYNGDPGSSGWGILQQDDQYIVLFGGVTVFGSAPLTVNQWTDIALVQNNGNALLYLNGVPVSSDAGDSYHPPTGIFAIATKPVSPGTQNITAELGEVRVFSFAPGAFQVSDLLTPVLTAPPGPTLNISMSAGNHTQLSWAATNTTYGLEYADSPNAATWTKVRGDLTNGCVVVNDVVPASARYYRLISPFGAVSLLGGPVPPALPPGGAVLGNGDPIPVIFPYVYGWEDASTAGGATINVSGMIDPDCPTNNSLTYLWDVSDSDVGEDLVSPYLTGTATPKISWNGEVLIDDDFTFILTVTSKYSNLSTAINVDVPIQDSDYTFQDIQLQFRYGPPYTLAVARGTPGWDYNYTVGFY